jgi:hypothetical protein
MKIVLEAGRAFGLKPNYEPFQVRALLAAFRGSGTRGNEGNEGMLAGAALFVPGIFNSGALWGDRLRVR